MALVVEDHDLLVCPRCKAVFRTGFRACPRDGEALVATRTDPLILTTFADRYQIESLIGEGGIGRVYKARHARMSRRYAVKIPYGEVAYDPKVRARFANEAEAASRLSHPNVVNVVDFGETEAGLLYMAMDYAEGVSLAALIGESGPLDRAWVIRFTREIAEGLAHAHDKGLVHRDLKPDNIIIERDGDRPRIVDFGLAIFREQEGGRLTTQGTVLGTPHYMAPEQATGQEIDQRTNLFALGLCMYEMLAGVLPFDGTPVQVARRNLSSPVPLIGERVPGLEVDPGLEALCHHMLAKRPDDRPVSAHAVIEMLTRLERGDTHTWRMDQQSLPAAGAPAASAAPGPSGRSAPSGASAPATSSAPLGVSPTGPTISSSPLPAVAPPLAAPPAIARADGPPVVAADARLRAPTTDDLATLGQPERRRRIIIVAAALALLIGGIAVWRIAGTHDTVASVPPTPDATAIVVIPLDAAPAPPPVADAAVAVATLVDAAPPGRPDARTAVAVRPRPDARPSVASRPDAAVIAVARPDARPAVVVRPDAAPPPVVAEKTVRQMYARVGEAIERLRASKGDAAADKFKDEWLELPYMDALGNPTLRPDLIRNLKVMEQKVIGATR